MVSRTRPDVPVVHTDEVEHRRQLAVRTNASLTNDGTNSMIVPLGLQLIDGAGDFPDASLWRGALIYDIDTDHLTVSDGVTWSSLATSDELDAAIAALPAYSTGTWTPTLTTNDVDFGSVTYSAVVGGRYVKIGALVHIQGTMSTDAITIGSATGDVVIGGLPFQVAGEAGAAEDGRPALAVADVSSWAGTRPGWALFGTGTNYLKLIGRLLVEDSDATTQVTDVDTGGGANHIRFGGTYITDE